ncbi:phosphoglycolate phosphatase [Sulfurimonas diazotrophicus]|uniref:Phosphoglycolate phosphatase n=1 Tax=Sulfurimonas diazotrophicus TaxID=3131939 RepID=A0ABZ3HCE6_9BACT
MFKHKELILFDFDGTLIDSAPDLALAVNHMLEQLGRPPFEETTVRGWVGNGARTLVERALRASSDTEDAAETVDRALAIFLEFYAGNLAVLTRPYPQVPEVLQQLHQEGYRLAIVTNKPYAFIEPILHSLGMSELFEYTLGGDSLPQRKPDPRPLLHVCETLGVDKERCVMVGDSKNDILAAKAAGMDAIGLGYGYNYGEAIASYTPNLVCDTFAEVAVPFGVSHGVG